MTMAVAGHAIIATMTATTMNIARVRQAKNFAKYSRYENTYSWRNWTNVREFYDEEYDSDFDEEDGDREDARVRRMKEITEGMNVIFMVNTRREKIRVREVITKRDIIIGITKDATATRIRIIIIIIITIIATVKKTLPRKQRWVGIQDGTLVWFLSFFYCFYCHVARDLYILSRGQR